MEIVAALGAALTIPLWGSWVGCRARVRVRIILGWVQGGRLKVRLRITLTVTLTLTLTFEIP